MDQISNSDRIFVVFLSIQSKRFKKLAYANTSKQIKEKFGKQSFFI